MKIIVLNLDRGITKEELKVLFEEFGAVQSCDLVLDNVTGKSKGFGFIEMPKPGEAKLAIKSLNNKKVAANRIRVRKAKNKKV